jgi:hypothetical protein
MADRPSIRSFAALASGALKGAADRASEEKELTIVGKAIEALTHHKRKLLESEKEILKVQVRTEEELKRLDKLEKELIKVKERTNIETKKQLKLEHDLLSIKNAQQKVKDVEKLRALKKYSKEYNKSLEEQKKIVEEVTQQQEQQIESLVEQKKAVQDVTQEQVEASKANNKLQKSGSLVGNAFKLVTNKYLNGATAMWAGTRLMHHYTMAGQLAAESIISLGQAEKGMTGYSISGAKAVNEVISATRSIGEGSGVQGVKALGSGIWNMGKAAGQAFADITGLGTSVQSMAEHSFEEAHAQLVKFGNDLEKDHELFDHFSRALADIGVDHTVGSISKLVVQTEILSKALDITSDEALASVQEGMAKTGKSAEEANDDLASIYQTIQAGNKQAKAEFGHSVFGMRKFTEQVLNVRTNIRGYNVDVKSLTSFMAGAVNEATKFGASQEQATKASKTLAEIVTSGAPDWVKYLGGKDLISSMVGIDLSKPGGVDAIKKKMGELPADAIKQLTVLQEMQKKGLIQEYDYTRQVNSILEGTTAGMEANFKVMKKYAGNSSVGMSILGAMGVTDPDDQRNIFMMMKDAKFSPMQLAKTVESAKANALEKLEKGKDTERQKSAKAFVETFASDPGIAALFKTASGKSLVTQIKEGLDTAFVLKGILAASVLNATLGGPVGKLLGGLLKRGVPSTGPAGMDISGGMGQPNKGMLSRRWTDMGKAGGYGSLGNTVAGAGIGYGVGKGLGAGMDLLGGSNTAYGDIGATIGGGIGGYLMGPAGALIGGSLGKGVTETVVASIDLIKALRHPSSKGEDIEKVTADQKAKNKEKYWNDFEANKQNILANTKGKGAQQEALAGMASRGMAGVKNLQGGLGMSKEDIRSEYMKRLGLSEDQMKGIESKHQISQARVETLTNKKKIETAAKQSGKFYDKTLPDQSKEALEKIPTIWEEQARQVFMSTPEGQAMAAKIGKQSMQTAAALQQAEAANTGRSTPATQTRGSAKQRVAVARPNGDIVIPASVTATSSAVNEVNYTSAMGGDISS